ncbi:hypothetical protein EDB19DRAFT_1832780 [Suillus lakei]|nr:hypothetical protein EDB19DRAFT_1832780 [Suillus lakei]
MHFVLAEELFGYKGDRKFGSEWVGGWGADVHKVARVLERNLKRYPNGVFFLLGVGRLVLVRPQSSKALANYACAAQAQTQHRNLHHTSWWESTVACLGLTQ